MSLKQPETLSSNLGGQLGPPSENTSFLSPWAILGHPLIEITKSLCGSDCSQLRRGPSNLTGGAVFLLTEGFIFICLEL